MFLSGVQRETIISNHLTKNMEYISACRARVAQCTEVPNTYLGASFVLVFISNFSGSIKVLFWPSTFHQTVNVWTWLLPRSSGAGSWHGASQLFSSWSDFYPGVLGSGQLWLFVPKRHPQGFTVCPLVEKSVIFVKIFVKNIYIHILGSVQHQTPVTMINNVVKSLNGWQRYKVTLCRTMNSTILLLTNQLRKGNFLLEYLRIRVVE